MRERASDQLRRSGDRIARLRGHPCPRLRVRVRVRDGVGVRVRVGARVRVGVRVWVS